jgi:hypothetical protein
VTKARRTRKRDKNRNPAKKQKRSKGRKNN